MKITNTIVQTIQPKSLIDRTVIMCRNKYEIELLPALSIGNHCTEPMVIYLQQSSDINYSLPFDRWCSIVDWRYPTANESILIEFN